MKPSIILEQRLYESKLYSQLIQGMPAATAAHMQTVRESFTLPFIASLSNINVLTEAAMTAQQIQNAFGSAEKIATAGGDNRSLVGMGADAAGAVGAGAVDLAKKGAAGVKQIADRLIAQHKAKLEQSLPPADAGPVEGFEQKAQEQIAQVQDPKAKKSLMDLVKQAAKNPAVQTLVLAGIAGIATAVAGPAIAGLGLGMAATGALTGTVVGGLTGVVRGAMQGEGLKGALKQGAMGAGLGALGGGVAGAIAQGAQAYMQNKNQPPLPAADADANRAADENAAAQWAAGTPEERAQIEQTTGMTPQQLQSKIPDEFDSGPGKGWDSQAPAANPTASKVGAVQSTPDAENFDGTATAQQRQDAEDAVYQQAKASGATGSTSTQQVAGPDAVREPLKIRPNLDQWRADNAAAKTVTQSRVNSGTPLNEYVDYELTARMWYLRESVGKSRGNIHLTEAGIGDMFRKAGNWLKTKAGNVTNKVTADKLQQAWKKAGNPTDSGQVAAIMVGAGVPQETVDQVFQNLGLPAGSSTPTQAPAQAPGQGILGKVGGAIGGAIGGVKGAIAGTKDAFAKGKETGFDTARANQAGDAVGATGEANPYAKQDAQQAPSQPAVAAAPQGQQPSYGQGGAPQAYGVAPRSTPASQATGSTSATAQGTTDTGNDVDAFGAVKSGMDAVGSAINTGGNKVADTVNDLNRAVQAGRGMGASGQSLVRGPYAPGGEGAGRDAVKIKDEYGQEHAYRKVGAKWYDKDNKEVPPAIAAMLTKQADQQAALAKDKTAAVPTQSKIPGPKPPAGQPTTAATTAAKEPISIGGQKLDPNDPASAKIIAQVQQAQGGAQPPAALDPRDLNKDGTVDATEKSIARNKAKTAATPPAATAATPPAEPAAAAEPTAQSPEEIRKAKQAAAAQTAQGQMAANPAPTKPATANYGRSITGYGKTTTNAPAGVPNPTAQMQPTTGAKTAPVPTASAQADVGKPGFLQNKLKGSQVPAQQTVNASIDYSAALLRKMKQRV